MLHLTRRGMVGAAALAAPALMAGMTVSDPRPAASDWSAITQIAEAAIASGVTPGLQISVGERDQVHFSRGFGLANLETETAVAKTSVFRIGSITKEFTAALLLSLAGRGRLTLGDPVGRYLPDFPLPDLNLDQLLTHTSGLSNYTSAVTAEVFLQQSRLDRTPAEMVAVVSTAEPLQQFPAGSNWAYSNSGYILLGAVIEAITGDYAEALAEFLRPVGLQHTAVDNAADIVAGRVSGYAAIVDTEGEFENASFVAMTNAGASGAMRSTADDLNRWRSVLLAGELLSEASLRKIITPVRLASGELPSDESGGSVFYGGGVYLDPLDGAPAMRGGGAIQGFSASCDTVIQSGLSIAILMNVQPHGAPGFSALGRDLRRAVQAVIAPS